MVENVVVVDELFFEDFEEADFVVGFDQDLVVERDARFLTDEFLAELAAE